ncbi:MAG: hypothetical protein IPN86_18090 [Saprospiraceae bacterium]|jgi:hypothetical protein|nr:hypothetical protein [Saprospiraceae bacterium]
MRMLVFLFLLGLWGLFSCSKQQKANPTLQMTSDEIVEALVQMYTVNAAININDIKYRDSTSNQYFKQIATMSGKSIDVIKSDFEKLQSMQDTLLVLQNRALDTLRVLQEKQLRLPSQTSPNLN